MNNKISIKGAKEHNLKNISVEIPKNKLIVITGMSGSGKSSLAFDTIYAEGQRRYVESLSAYARQFLEVMKKPDVEHIEGLSPAISIEQKTTSKNPRSTVGTVTEIYDYMRLLWARIGVPYSPFTGLPIKSQSVREMVENILKMPVDTKIYLIAPIVRGRKGEYKKEIANLQKQGFARIIVDGEIMDIENFPELDKNKKHNIEVLVDRLVVKPDIAQRLSASIETALSLSDGLLYVQNLNDNSISTFSSKFACPVSGFTLEEIEPRNFSFNAPYGACPECLGLGFKLYMDTELIVPDPSKSLRQGAIVPWTNILNSWTHQILEGVCKAYGQSMDTPYKDFPDDFKNVLMFGSGKRNIPLKFTKFETNKPFEGVVNNLERRFRESESLAMKEELTKYQNSAPCEACKGKRLKPESLCVKIMEKDISDATLMPINTAIAWYEKLEGQLSGQTLAIAEKIIKEIKERLSFLSNVGLDYLNLARSSASLSGGEAQRIRLASQIGSGLTGVLYVLDEPSIGLHQRDNDKLIAALKKLKDIGNTVIVVEHDEDAIKAADFIIDMGPRAGVHGGEIIQAGGLEDILKNPSSLTGAYLKGEKSIPIPSRRRKGNGKKLKLLGVRTNNLKNIDVTFPLGKMICVTGVSGSGKSSLIIETLANALMKNIYGSHVNDGVYSGIEGTQNIDKIIEIDQSPIGRTPRSNPATYTGVFTNIREWFASLPEAKVRGYKEGRFSFNVKGGRCEACKGDGLIKIEMHFLPDVYVLCDECKGKRFNPETLEVTYKGKNIADVLDMPVDEACELFAAVPAIKNKLEFLQKVGLGYIKLGQSALTLSGGEAQRVKLAKELSKRSTGKTLYILDEPTTGLHFEDINKLLDVLNALTDQGNTLIIIEHNLDVIKTADHIIDIGPEGGDAGGEIVAVGTPEDIIKLNKSHTAKYLKKVIHKI